jgi:DNA-binding transcriptional regulator YiaG
VRELKPMDGEELERLRIKVGLPTQKAAAEYFDVNERTYRRWITGELEIPVPAIRLLRLAAKVGLDEKL